MKAGKKSISNTTRPQHRMFFGISPGTSVSPKKVRFLYYPTISLETESMCTSGSSNFVRRLIEKETVGAETVLKRLTEYQKVAGLDATTDFLLMLWREAPQSREGLRTLC